MMDREELAERLKSMRHVMLDMDGTVYCGDRLFETTKPFLSLLGSLGIGFSFLTNNSSKSVEEHAEKLERMGIEAGKDSVYSSTLFAADYIKEAFPGAGRLHVLGTESMKLELQRLGFSIVSSRPDAVVVGYDAELSYQKLCRAAHWVASGLPLIATHPDKLCPSDLPDFMAIDCGCITEMLERACGRKGLVLGKPRPEMIGRAMRRLGRLSPREVAMCGDRRDTDVRMALDSGVLAVHVCHSPAPGEPAPHLSVPDLMAFGRMLERAEGARSR